MAAGLAALGIAKALKHAFNLEEDGPQLDRECPWLFRGSYMEGAKHRAAQILVTQDEIAVGGIGRHTILIDATEIQGVECDHDVVSIKTKRRTHHISFGFTGHFYMTPGAGLSARSTARTLVALVHALVPNLVPSAA